MRKWAEPEMSVALGRGSSLRAKRDESQEREASLACELLNRMLELGRPQYYPVC